MDMTSLLEKRRSILDYMQVRGFSMDYIRKHRTLMDRAEEHFVKGEWKTTDDMHLWIDQQPYTEGYRETCHKCASNLEYFCAKGFFHGNGNIQAALREMMPSCGTLDLMFLQEHDEELYSYMRSVGYGEEYIFSLRQFCHRIIYLSRTIPWASYEEIWNWYQRQGLKPFPLQNVRARLGILEAFHLRHQFPCGSRCNPLCNRYGAYHKINPDYRKLVDYAVEQYRCAGQAESSIRRNRSGGASFLWFMECIGATELSMITSSHVYQYYSSSAKKNNGRGLTPRLKKFFETCVPYDEECKRVMLLLPLAPSGRENIQYINDEEGAAFLQALTDMNNGLSYLARAVGMILYYLGLRRADITNLKLDDIDLQKQEINIVQRKTRVPLTLPLPVVVGNAIYDYCVHERPDTDSAYLFLGPNAPHNPLGWSTASFLLGQIYNEAGIRLNAGDRRGSHVFRHRMATKMLENNIAPVVISQTLGHSSPESLDAYLYADKVHLKECALSLVDFPVSEEVFSRV